VDHFTQSARNSFTGYNLERVHHQAQDNVWVAEQCARDEARFLPMWHLQHLIAAEFKPVLLTRQEVESMLPVAESITLLGYTREHPYFAVVLPDDAPPSNTLTARGQFQELRAIASLLSQFDGGLLAYARAMAHWHHQQRYCGVCGHLTESTWGGLMRRCTNPACGQQHFPRTDAAIIVRTAYQDRILLGRQPHWNKGRYSNIAGFVAPGESFEDAVMREVQEETGVQVKTVQYHSSQPWPFPQSLMVGFTAEAASDALCAGLECGDGELEDARWFTRADIRKGLEQGTLGLPSRISISFHLIEDWFDEGDEGTLRALPLMD